MARAPTDSRGCPLRVGDRVRFRGQIYTIKQFGPATGTHGTSTLIFEEEYVHTTEVPDEINVDKAWVTLEELDDNPR